MHNNLLYTGTDWDFPMIDKVYKAVENVAFEKYQMQNIYRNQLEIISSDQMIDAYASHGLPIMYKHWSFGKLQDHHKKLYTAGMENLAYEIVINSDPCISYLMENNTATLQTLVIAHAAFGHNFFFKNNYLFRQWTDAGDIVDYLMYAKQFVEDCETQHGVQAVEDILDAAHSLMFNGVDKVKRAKKRTEKEEKELARKRRDHYESRINELWPSQTDKPEVLNARKKAMLPEPEANLLYFLEKNSPILEAWQRELLRIVRKIAQYFYPQMLTKISNEGFASKTHYNIMHDLYNAGRIDEGAMFEFMRSHTGVISQQPWDSKYFADFNPYYVGFNIYNDLQRICEKPTDEDKRWFPYIAGAPWNEVYKDAVENYKDDSFILQFLSPNKIREMKLFRLTFNDQIDPYNFNVNDIHDDDGYREVRSALARSQDLSKMLPQIEVVDVALDGDRTLFLKHTRLDGVSIDTSTAKQVLANVKRLWGFDVELKSKPHEPPFGGTIVLNTDDFL